jgi:GTPase SAR1 family protein
VDSSDVERFEEAKESLHGMFEDENMMFVPLLVLANKSDIVKCKDLSLKLGLQNLQTEWHV